jgi:hypothetical protein
MQAITNYQVYAPCGAFGNHLRWLLLLDEKYTLILDKQLISTANEKVDFISKNVYTNNRNFKNWLSYEFRYRSTLDQWLKFTHSIEDVLDERKGIGCSIDPKLAYQEYVKFNPSLNGLSVESFYQMIQKSNKFCNFAEQYYPIFKHIDSGRLYNEKLDFDLYSECIDFLNLTLYYNEAQEIHSMWFFLHNND